MMRKRCHLAIDEFIVFDDGRIQVTNEDVYSIKWLLAWSEDFGEEMNRVTWPLMLSSLDRLMKVTLQLALMTSLIRRDDYFDAILDGDEDVVFEDDVLIDTIDLGEAGDIPPIYEVASGLQGQGVFVVKVESTDFINNIEDYDYQPVNNVTAALL